MVIFLEVIREIFNGSVIPFTHLKSYFQNSKDRLFLIFYTLFSKSFFDKTGYM